MKPLLSQVVQFTKSIYLRQPAVRSFASKFIAGSRSPFSFVGGFGLCWWYTKDTFKVVDTIADLILRHSSDFKDCDRETASEVIKKTLQQICLDAAIFHGDAVAFAQFETLFECRSCDVAEFAEAILERISINLRARIGRRCTIHALPRIQVPSFRIKSDSISVIAKGDTTAWVQFASEGYLFDGWTPDEPFLGGNRSLTFAPPADFQCLFVAEENGTQKGTRFNSILRFRKLGAVMLAIASRRSGHLFSKSGAMPYEFCLQLPHTSSPDRAASRNDCPPIIPYFVSDISLDSEDVESIQEWYECLVRCPQDSRSRLEKGAHFLNRGVNSSDIEAYINYFVTLDALFGERGSVEASILGGLKQVNIPPDYLEKAPWLFDLRNELVHGGSRFISEWPKYTRYIQHFRSKPMDDVQSLAQLAVLQAPLVFAT